MIQYPKDIQETELLRAWIQKRVPNLDIGNDSVCLGVWRDKKLAAVAAFYNYRKVDIELAFASDNPRWATRQTIQWILAFPFLQLNTQRVTSMVLKSNKRCRKLLLGAGFMEEGKHPHSGPRLETMFSYGMIKMKYMERYGSDIRPAKAGVDVGDCPSSNSIYDPNLSVGQA